MRRLLAASALAALAAGAHGAPSLAPAVARAPRTVQSSLDLGLSERDISYRFDRSAPFVQEASSRRVLAGLDYRIDRSWSVGVRLGVADIDGGEVNALGARRSLGGDMGFAWGVRTEWEREGGGLGVGHSAAILLDYQRWSSSLPAGDVDADEFGVALRYAAPFPLRWAPDGRLYAGIRWSEETYDVALPSVNGRGEERDAVGLFLGYDWAVSHRLRARLEGRFLDRTDLTLSLASPIGEIPAYEQAQAPAPVPERRAPPAPRSEATPARTQEAAPRLPEVVVGPPAPRPTSRPPAFVPPPPSGSYTEAEAALADGNRFASLGRYREAIEAYRRALSIRPDDHRAHYNLGTVLYASRDWRGARDAYREAVRLRPDSTNAWIFLGLAAYRTGEADEAVRAWRRALELDPANETARRNLEAIGR